MPPAPAVLDMWQEVVATFWATLAPTGLETTSPEPHTQTKQVEPSCLAVFRARGAFNRAAVGLGAKTHSLCGAPSAGHSKARTRPRGTQ